MTSSEPTSSAPVQFELPCPHCGYDLRATLDARCPECGRPFDRAILSRSPIPWVLRGEIGRFRAFCRTADMAVRRPQMLVRSLAAEHPPRDARLFRWLCMLPVAGVFCFSVAMLNVPQQVQVMNKGPIELLHTWAGQALLPLLYSYSFWPVIVGVIVMWGLSLALLPMRVASFTRREPMVRNGVLSASQYTCAAMLMGALIGAALVVVFGVIGTAIDGAKNWALLLQIAAVAVPLFTFIAWAIANIRLFRRLPYSRPLPLIRFLLFALLFVLSTINWLIVVPWVAGFLYIAFLSLHG